MDEASSSVTVASPPKVEADLAVQSFSRVALPESIQLDLAGLEVEALKFFDEATQDVELSVKKWRQLLPTENGGIKLCGFNEPSSSKSLFRYFRSTSVPWPSETFRNAVEACEHELREVLIDTFDSVTRSLFSGAVAMGRDVSYRSLQGSSVGTKDFDDPCPFDIFFYYNDDSKGRAPNCTDHVDRGLMHIIVSRSPGLEVMHAEAQRWISPAWEETPCAHTSGDGKKRRKVLDGTQSQGTFEAVVIVNAALQELSAGPRGNGLPVCVHRVVRGTAPRLSFSFELRLKDETAEAMEKLKSHCHGK